METLKMKNVRLLCSMVVLMTMITGIAKTQAQPTVTLTATPSEVAAGQTITVTWTAVGDTSSNDWIGLYSQGAPNVSPLDWKYTGGSATGSVTFDAPETLGTYEFRYLLSGGYTDVATSNPVTVVLTLVFTAQPKAIGLGMDSTLSWNTSGATECTASEGWSGTKPLEGSEIVNPTTTTTYTLTAIGPVVSTSRSVTVGVTGPVTLNASPSTVAPGQTITVTWTAEGDISSTDWIGLYSQGAPNGSYIAWKYTGGSATGSVTFNAPSNTGTYEFRYLLKGGYIDVATSNPVIVEEFTIHYPDYLPVDPEKHGIKTFVFTYGQSGQYTSEIIGMETVPYVSGDITGVKISNSPYGSTGIMYNDGINVKTLGEDNDYLSTDCLLTAHPLPWSFSTLTDGMLIDLGLFYVLENDLSTCIPVDYQQILISIQDVTVPWGDYTDAVIFWWLDTRYPFKALNLYGQESDLGITLPTASETGGYSVIGVGIRGFDTGTIAFGEIDASTGYLTSLSVLDKIEPVPSLSGWVWMESGGDFGYSLDEGDWLYFVSFWPVWYYNFTTDQWLEEGPLDWIYINWPYYYELDTDTWWFAYPPGDGLWIYHFRTGEWSVLPQLIP